MKKIVSIICVSITVSACTSYTHSRFDPQSGNAIESTSLRAPWLTKTAIAGLKSRVSDKHATNGVSTYTRSIGVESVDSSVDAAGIQAIESLIGRALLEGLKTTAPVP